MATSVKSAIEKIITSRTFKVVIWIGLVSTIPLLSLGGYNTSDYTVRDISHVVTSISAVLSSIIGLQVASSGVANKSAMNVTKGFAIALGLPLVVHLISTFFMNNIGGLGAE